MAVVALLRSVASKMARAPPRHGPSATSSSRLRLSTGSTPPHTEGTGSGTRNKKYVNEPHWATAAFIKAAPAAYFMAFSGLTFTYFWFIPALDRLDGHLDDAIRQTSDMIDEIKRSEQSLRELNHSEEDQIEARDLVGGQGKNQGGRQA